MSRSAWPLAAAGLVCIAGAAAPAHADFSACESATRQTDLREQIRLYQICLKKGGVGSTDLSGAFNNIGADYVALGDEDQALANFNSAIEFYAGWGTPFLNRARIYLNRRQWTQAESDASAALKIPPGEQWPQALLMRAQARFGLGKAEDARADLEEAVKRGRAHAEVYERAAQVLAAYGESTPQDHARAVELGQEAVRRKDAAPAHDALAFAYARSGDLEKAVSEEQRAIELARRAGTPETAYARRLAMFQARAAGPQPASAANPAP